MFQLSEFSFINAHWVSDAAMRLKGTAHSGLRPAALCPGHHS